MFRAKAVLVFLFGVNFRRRLPLRAEVPFVDVFVLVFVFVFVFIVDVFVLVFVFVVVFVFVFIFISDVFVQRARLPKSVAHVSSRKDG